MDDYFIEEKLSYRDIGVRGLYRDYDYEHNLYYFSGEKKSIDIKRIFYYFDVEYYLPNFKPEYKNVTDVIDGVFYTFSRINVYRYKFDLKYNDYTLTMTNKTLGASWKIEQNGRQICEWKTLKYYPNLHIPRFVVLPMINLDMISMVINDADYYHFIQLDPIERTLKVTHAKKSCLTSQYCCGTIWMERTLRIHCPSVLYIRECFRLNVRKIFNDIVPLDVYSIIHSYIDYNQYPLRPM